MAEAGRALSREVRGLSLAVNAVSAQAKNWPKLDDVKQVTARIDHNIENNNRGAFTFATVLSQQTLQLSKSEVPAPYKSAKTTETLKALNAKAEELNKRSLEKASFEELQTKFTEFKALLNSLTPESKTK